MKSKGYKVTGIDKLKLFRALRRMGPKYLKSSYKSKWSRERPTTGYCYVVSEFLYHYIFKRNVDVYFTRVGKGTHWYLKQDGKIIDLTADQFIDETVNYNKGQRASFITKHPSKRAIRLYNEYFKRN